MKTEIEAVLIDEIIVLHCVKSHLLQASSSSLRFHLCISVDNYCMKLELELGMSMVIQVEFV